MGRGKDCVSHRIPTYTYLFQILWSYPVPWSHEEGNGIPNPMVLSHPVVTWGGEWYPKSYGPIPSRGPMGRGMDCASHRIPTYAYPKSYGPIPSRGPMWRRMVLWFHGERTVHHIGFPHIHTHVPIPNPMVLSCPVVPWGGERTVHPIGFPHIHTYPKSYGPFPSHGHMGRGKGCLAQFAKIADQAHVLYDSLYHTMNYTHDKSMFLSWQTVPCCLVSILLYGFHDSYACM